MADSPTPRSTAGISPAESRSTPERGQRPASADSIGREDLDDEVSSDTLIAFIGGASRSGEWTPPERLQVVAVMGGVDLDFRRALLAPGLSEVRVFALMGGVTITVPKDLPIEVTATAILGGVDQGPLKGGSAGPSASSGSPGSTGGFSASAAAADAPRNAATERRSLVMVSGVAIMSGITIRVD
ncbi:MAG TPA: LiaF domain-containing protein [Stellaceae bacterium]|nr:LiaF domain-containing protein [Stellaceae bacterium]